MSSTQPSFPIPTTAKILGIDEERGPSLLARSFGYDRTMAAAPQTRFANDYHRACAAETQVETLVTLGSSADRNLSPPKVSPKREFLRFWLETFGRFSLELSLFGVRRPVGDARKARKMQGCSAQRSPSLVERVAGCLGRDRTPTFPIVFRPLISLKNFC
jgi:hypothetical protein